MTRAQEPQNKKAKLLKKKNSYICVESIKKIKDN